MWLQYWPLLCSYGDECVVTYIVSAKWLFLAVPLACCLVKADGTSEALSLEPNTLDVVSDDYHHSDFLFAVLFGSIIDCVISVSGCMMNDGGDSIPVSSDDENDESARRERYRYQSLSECSDPDLWQSIHHHDMINDSEDEMNPPPMPSRTPRPVRRPSPLLCYMSLSNAFGKLRELMIRDHQQRGRGHAVLHHLFVVLRQFNEVGISEESIRLLHQMVMSLMQMEAETNARSIGVPAYCRYQCLQVEISFGSILCYR